MEEQDQLQVMWQSADVVRTPCGRARSPQVPHLTSGRIQNTPRTGPCRCLLRNSEPDSMSGGESHEGQVCSWFCFFKERNGLQVHFRWLVEQLAYRIDVDRQQRRQQHPVLLSTTDLSPADKQRDLPGGRVQIEGTVATDRSQAQPGRQTANDAVSKSLQPVGNIYGVTCLKHYSGGGWVDQSGAAGAAGRHQSGKAAAHQRKRI